MTKAIDGKIAVFISGPVRYVTLVNRRLESVLADCDYDCFFHLWKADLGNKLRAGEECDYRELFDHPRAKVVILQSPYSQDDFKDTVGTETNSSSPINATMGMFYSVNLLCHYLQQLPDFDEYKYILRLRTDCAILNDDFASLLDPNPEVLTVPLNYFVPLEWISDHICFGTIENFFRLWRYEDIHGIYDAYEAADKHPEITLTRRHQIMLKKVKLNRSIERYIDYHIIYYPPQDADPQFVVDALARHGVADFFQNGRNYVDLAEIDEMKTRCSAECEQWWARRKAEKRLRKGDEKLLGGDVDTAANALMEAYELCPSLGEKHWRNLGFHHRNLIHRLAADILTLQPDNKGACEVNRFYEQNRTDAERLLKAGVKQLQTGKDANAFDSLNRAFALCPILPELNYARAALFAKFGKLGSAKEACQAELAVQPDHQGAIRFLGRLEEALSEFAAAGKDKD